MIQRRAGVATAALAVACGETPAQQPDIHPANNTIEQVTHNLGYENVLGSLSLGRHFSLDIANGLSKQRLNVYNYTNDSVSPRAVQAIASLYENTIGASSTFTFNINPTSVDKDVPITADAIQNPDTEHDFVLVPDGTPASVLFGGGPGEDAITATTDLAARNMNADQTISIVVRPNNQDDGQPGSFLKDDDGLTTEMCQALVDVVPEPPADSTDATTTRLAQEGFCNSVGNATLRALNGTDYSTYTSIETGTEGVVTIPDVGGYAVQEFVVSPSLYTTMQHALASAQ